MADQDSDDHFYDEDDHDPDEFEEECGMLPDGTCMLAGSEHCDWDCGALNAQRIAAMKESADA